jgi:hypothetical protein
MIPVLTQVIVGLGLMAETPPKSGGRRRPR